MYVDFFILVRLYPLGMETKIIKDDQITAFGFYKKNEGRLHLNADGAYGYNNNEYLTIDLMRHILIQAVAIQGSGKRSYSNEIVKRYNIKYGNSSSNLLTVPRVCFSTGFYIFRHAIHHESVRY